MTLPEAIEFLNSRLRFHNSRVNRFKTDKPDHSKLHAKTAATHVAIISLLEKLASDPTINVPGSVQEDVFSLNPFDMDDLPENLRDDLNLPKGDVIEAQIIKLFEIAKRPLTTNEVLVSIYRTYDQQLKKNALGARLYRLVKSKQLESVEKKKGLYRLPDPPNDPANNVVISISDRENLDAADG